jgi:hypothetical protein
MIEQVFTDDVPRLGPFGATDPKCGDNLCPHTKDPCLMPTPSCPWCYHNQDRTIVLVPVVSAGGQSVPD